MRFYDYRCDNGHKFERFESTSTATITDCDICDAEAHRIITSPVGIEIPTPKPKDYSASERKQRWDAGLA